MMFATTQKLVHKRRLSGHSAIVPARRQVPILRRLRGAGGASISCLLEMLAAIPGPRDPRGTHYVIQFIVAIAMVAVLAMAEKLR
jgi:hypothetical protein